MVSDLDWVIFILILIASLILTCAVYLQNIVIELRYANTLKREQNELLKKNKS